MPCAFILHRAIPATSVLGYAPRTRKRGLTNIRFTEPHINFCLRWHYFPGERNRYRMKKGSLTRKSGWRLAVLGLVLFLCTSLVSGFEFYRQNIDTYTDLANSYVFLASTNVRGDMIRLIEKRGDDLIDLCRRYIEAEKDAGLPPHGARAHHAAAQRRRSRLARRQNPRDLTKNH